MTAHTSIEPPTAHLSHVGRLARRPIPARVRAMVSFRATLHHAAAVLLAALSACEFNGDINVTSSNSGEESSGGESGSTTGGESGSTTTGWQEGGTSNSSSGGTSNSSSESGSTGAGSSGETGDTSTGEVPTCPDPLNVGSGGIEIPQPGYTVSGCFDDAAVFGCTTCSAWCEAGSFGACVGGAPLDDCTSQNGLGYTIDCNESIFAEAAWKCVCKA